MCHGGGAGVTLCCPGGEWAAVAWFAEALKGSLVEKRLSGWW